jgi:hypothetical protein
MKDRDVRENLVGLTGLNRRPLRPELPAELRVRVESLVSKDVHVPGEPLL